MIRTVAARRYSTPLREGGSLPAIIEADDDALYVVKFLGAGQGSKALIAELVGGEIARALGLPVPELVFVQIDTTFGRSEPDPEIQELLRMSAGLNLALAYIPGALAFDPVLAPPPDAELASAIVWLDALITNVDRTPRNTNMLVKDGQLWLIDHGAALFFHHTWHDYQTRSRSPFLQIKDHVLLPRASAIETADATFSGKLGEPTIRTIIDLIPAEWLHTEALFATPAANREAYVEYLLSRLTAPRAFAEEAIRAHAALV